MGWSPTNQGVDADGTKIVQRGEGDLQLHASPRTAATNCLFDLILTTCPESSWAKPMAASRCSQSFSRSRRRDSRRASGVKMTRSIMLRACPLLDLLPCAARSRMLKESRFATKQFVALCVGNRQHGVLLSDAIPKVFDELEPFSPTQPKSGANSPFMLTA